MGASHLSGPLCSRQGVSQEGVAGQEAMSGRMFGVRTLSLPVTAVANTDFTLDMPTGATILGYNVFTTTAYGAATDATLQIGNAAAGAQLVAAITIKAAGCHQNLVMVDDATSAAFHLSVPSSPGKLFLRIVQTGAASAVGAATFTVMYALPLVALTP